MDRGVEKECDSLAGLFQIVVGEMKNSYPAWEDFGQKAAKLSVQLKTTISTLNQFLDGLQKVSDYATNAKGSTRDIGTALTRICMRHRSTENRLKTISSSLMDCMVFPLQEHLESWKQRATNLDKNHAREFKRTKNEIRKRSTDTIRLKKKVRKGEGRMQAMLESAVDGVSDCYDVLLKHERKMCRAALVEQRSQFCYFVNWFKPVLDLELGLLEETSHLREVTDLLYKNAQNPNSLPPASEAVICDAKGLEHTWTQQFVSPPSSPSSLGSRKSSMCSLSSVEVDSINLSHRRGVPNQNNYRMQTNRGVIQPPFNSQQSQFVSSHDSGIANSQDVFYASSMQTSNGYHHLPVKTSISQLSTPSPSPSAVTWPMEPAVLNPQSSICPSPHPSPNITPRPHTISVADGGKVKHRAALSNSCFRPASQMNRPATLGLHSQNGTKENESAKPPLPNQRKQLIASMSTPTPTNGDVVPPIIPDFNAMQPDQYVPQAIYANVGRRSERRHRSGSIDGRVGSQRSGRPLSFVGDEDDMLRLLQAAGMSEYCDRSIRCESARDDDEETIVEGYTQSIMNGDPSYCTLPRKTSSAVTVNWRMNRKMSGHQVNRGPSSASSMISVCSQDRRTSKPGPPPPVRRNSTITAATPTAPSVELLRSNSGCTTPVEDHYSMSTLQMCSSRRVNRNDFSVSHETLMLQIRNGVNLHPPNAVNDRSAPKV